MTSLRIAQAQINPIVGDINGNFEKIRRRLDESITAGVDLVTFPELAVTGYPPEDLLLRKRFVKMSKPCTIWLKAVLEYLRLWASPILLKTVLQTPLR